jgi:predicted transcriptional regulator
MRTTLTIDDDIFAAVSALAKRRQQTIGRVLTELVRERLANQGATEPAMIRNGVHLLPKRNRDTVVTLELVNKIRDDEW